MDAERGARLYRGMLTNVVHSSADRAAPGWAEPTCAKLLKRMAEALLAPEAIAGFQAGGAKHCAVQDAFVALRVYQALLNR